MTNSKVVEVRLGCTMQELTEEQVFGVLEGLPLSSVGLGYGGEAAIVILGVPEEFAEGLGKQAEDLAIGLGLKPSLIEVLSTEDYEARALSEVEEGT